MNRSISTKTHGVIDYTWATAASTLSEGMPEAPRTGVLLRNAGMAATVNSVLTKYEAGVVRLLPMKGHLALDFVMCSALIASPFFLPASERRWAIVPVALGVVGLLTSLMTQTESPVELEDAGFTSPRQWARSVARDIDIAESPHLRAHVE